LRASRPSEPALSNPTKAKMARTTPTVTPPRPLSRSEICAVSRTAPCSTKTATQIARIAVTEIASSTIEVRTEIRTSEIATSTAPIRSTP
jgi:hypothetical protein